MLHRDRDWDKGSEAIHQGKRREMAPRDMDCRHHLPYRMTTSSSSSSSSSSPATTMVTLLEDPPYFSLSNTDANGGTGGGATADFCKGHGDNVKCDKCGGGGRGDGIVINEIDPREGMRDSGGGGGGVMVFGTTASEDENGDSDDEDRDGMVEVGNHPPSSCASSPSAMTPMLFDSAAGKPGVMFPQEFPPNPLNFTPGVNAFCAEHGGPGSAASLECPLSLYHTVLPLALGGEWLPGSICAAAGIGSEDSVMADGVDNATMVYDSGYESAMDGEGSRQPRCSNLDPGNRCCGSTFVNGGGGDDYEALYRHLKLPPEEIGGGRQRFVSPEKSSRGDGGLIESDDEEMLGNRTGHLNIVVNSRREVRGHMERSGAKILMNGGQKMGKVRKARDGRTKMVKQACFVGHAGVPWSATFGGISI